MSQVTDIKTVIPNEGDSVTIVNRGDWFCMIVHQHPTNLTLTDEEVEAMIEGRVTWN
jgi:hypothetical protein